SRSLAHNRPTDRRGPTRSACRSSPSTHPPKRGLTPKTTCTRTKNDLPPRDPAMSDSFPPDEFDGTARLFPLPNLVLFPHVAQPLHVFEPRYRQLMADAWAGVGLTTMAVWRPGWEEDYHKSPPIHPVVCVSQITQEERLADGRYNLVLQGLSRARIVEELTTDRLYRMATV